MAAASWGSTTVECRYEAHYYPASVPDDTSIIKICGTPGDTTSFNEVLHSPGGRPRYRVRVIAQLDDPSGYASFLADKVARTARTWTGVDGATLTSRILELSSFEYWQSNHGRFEMLLIEVV